MDTEKKPYQQTFDTLIAFGANQGDTQLAFENVLRLLKANEAISEIVASKAIETNPVTGSSSTTEQAQYLNACIRFNTILAVEQLHAAIVEIESELGRERKERWGPRTVDLDMLLFADQQVVQADLIVPHPRMSFRRFVLEPALEIAADMVHPVSGLSIEQLVHHLNTNPNSIVVATDDEPFAQSVVDDLAKRKELADWKIEVVTDAMAFIRSVGETKLVASCFSEAPPPDLVRFASNFAGPTIQLSIERDINGSVCELAAAIEAMIKG